MLIYYSERESASGGGAEEEGDAESEAGSGLRAVKHRDRRGARTHKPRDHDLSRSRTLNRLSHPGAPLMFICF